MSLTVITEPSVEPVTLSEAKRNLRVDGTDEDTHITHLITSARLHVEGFQGRHIIQTTVRLTLDGFSPVIRLPRPAWRSVSSIKYTDSNGAEQTLDSSKYQADLTTGRIIPAYGESWPTTRWELATVRVEFVSGYADDGASPPDYRANVPEDTKQAIMLLINELYERREAAIAGVTINTVPYNVEALASRHRHLVYD